MTLPGALLSPPSNFLLLPAIMKAYGSSVNFDEAGAACPREPRKTLTRADYPDVVAYQAAPPLGSPKKWMLRKLVFICVLVWHFKIDRANRSHRPKKNSKRLGTHSDAYIVLIPVSEFKGPPHS